MPFSLSLHLSLSASPSFSAFLSLSPSRQLCNQRNKEKPRRLPDAQDELLNGSEYIESLLRLSCHLACSLYVCVCEWVWMIASHLNCKMCIRLGESNDWKLLSAADHALACLTKMLAVEEGAGRERDGRWGEELLVDSWVCTGCEDVHKHATWELAAMMFSIRFDFDLLDLPYWLPPKKEEYEEIRQQQQQ